MKIPLPTEETRSELSVVPLVNVVFLLLVFFMLAGQISAPEPLDVEPPRSISDAESVGEPVGLLLTRDGQVALERVIVPAARLTDRIA
jgi:biopolymer transport protein ExbD